MAGSVSDLVACFSLIHQSAPDRTLIHVPGAGGQWSADDLWQAHRRYADRLAKIGVGEGDLVVSAGGNSAASVALLLACRALDAALMPVDAGATHPELLALAERFGATALLAPDTAFTQDPRLDDERAAALDAGLRVSPTRGIERQRYAGSAMLKLTSGSTGTAKATLTSEAQLMSDSARILAAMKTTPSDVQLATIPVSHAYGFGNLIMPVLLQGTPIVLRESFVPQQLQADARRFGASVFQGVPFMYQFFLSTPLAGGWPSSLTALFSAGAPLPAATVRAFHERFGVKIHSFYGTTESGGITLDDDDEIDDSGTVGRPLPGVTVTLRNEEDVAGRIHVASTSVASGYSHAGRGDDAFIDGGFLTGDCGVWDANGRLTLSGRVSSFVNVAGQKVRPDEVEDVLRTMPGIADARVVGADDPSRGEHIVACVVAEPQGSIAELAVRRFCAARLAPHKVPRTIVFVDAIPVTARGKIDRAALEGIVRARLSV
jgi:acyl-CoA synthetase (AMP-forming)/AMP-acid ligase II